MQVGNRTKFTVLGMLTIKNFTGYEIARMLESSTNYFWSESEGQIYPTLTQCVNEKLVTCKEQKAKIGNRLKKIYSITAKGKKELMTWLKKEPQKALVRDELLLKLFFGANVDSKSNKEHIIHRQRELEVALESYKKMREKLSTQYKNSTHLKYWMITLDFGIKSSKAELAWCKDTLKILNEEV